MDISFSYFWQAMISSPVLAITILLTLGVIFVNGWTDAPNAIATCVTTRCLNVRTAIWMSALSIFSEYCNDTDQQLCRFHNQQYGRFRQ